MCAEAKPQDCHRSKMIGPALQEVGIELMHVCEDGRSVKSQSEVMALLAGGQLGLFGPEMPLTSRRRYRPRR